MVTPRLIHPVPVEVRQIDRAATIYDPDASEPVQHAARAAVVSLVGQVSYLGGNDGKRLDRTKSGPSEGETGYVLFRYRDLAAASVSLKFNDRISKIGPRATDLYVTRVQDAGHYTDRGGATLVRAWFTDRRPQKQGA